ncbi:MAG: glucosamine-6-phosphate deaminase [Spirochaetota bacterium]
MDSLVEKIALEKSGFNLMYPPEEKVGVIVAASFPDLGKLAALRFLEWVQHNPEGVISLPTGKTPEYFIKEVQRFIKEWEQSHTQKELEEGGVDPQKRPDMRGLRFVQIDEFYPMNPLQHNSFYYYVNKYYIEGFGLDPSRCLLINCEKIGLNGKQMEEVWPDNEVDLSLRYRHPFTALEKTQKKVLEGIDQWCSDYEERVRSMGGIGFFLGGIGPDGHIGFNIRGSDLFSTTRLTPTNYETQAASAQDLGGIEIARKRLVITIGLATITYNPSCTALVIAAGEAKANIVKDSITSPRHINYPATVLQNLKQARFYLTRGASKLLTTRQIKTLQSSLPLLEHTKEKIVIDTALKKQKRIDSLTKSDFNTDPFGKLLTEHSGRDMNSLKKKTINNLEDKILSGAATRKNCVFLHTEPHHDDVMLGYLPGVVRHIREHSTTHFFATFTSGFTSVTNSFMLNMLTKLKRFMEKGYFHSLLKDDYFDPSNVMGKNRDVWQYLVGVASNSPAMMDEGRLRRVLRNLMYLYEEQDVGLFEDRINELINYFKTQYPGRKDLPHIQRLKGMCREYEAECLWGYFGWSTENIFHLRLGFYTGDIFNQEPTMERDVKPALDILQRVNPDIISIALDPEASGPDTHYKVLQVLTEALKLYQQKTGRSDIEIWGYRNVWYRFHPAEANMYIPVSLNMFALQDNAFKHSFLSQKGASFPSYEYDGPFSELAQKIQVEQYRRLKKCLGRKFFHEHSSALIRATRGMVFVKTMTLQQLYQHSREIKRLTENI